MFCERWTKWRWDFFFFLGMPNTLARRLMQNPTPKRLVIGVRLFSVFWNLNLWDSSSFSLMLLYSCFFSEVLGTSSIRGRWIDRIWNAKTKRERRKIDTPKRKRRKRTKSQRNHKNAWWRRSKHPKNHTLFHILLLIVNTINNETFEVEIFENFSLVHVLTEKNFFS